MTTIAKPLRLVSFRQACRNTFSRHQPKLNFGVNECVKSDVDVSNLISSFSDDEESVDLRKELTVVENSSKKCSIAHFIEGNDIAQRSINAVILIKHTVTWKLKLNLNLKI